MNIEQILNFLENICLDEQKSGKSGEVIEIDIEIITTKRKETILSNHYVQK